MFRSTTFDDEQRSLELSSLLRSIRYGMPVLDEDEYLSQPTDRRTMRIVHNLLVLMLFERFETKEPISLEFAKSQALQKNLRIVRDACLFTRPAQTTVCFLLLVFDRQGSFFAFGLFYARRPQGNCSPILSEQLVRGRNAKKVVVWLVQRVFDFSSVTF